MGQISRLEERLGLTRADITVALFLVGATLAGHLYLELRPQSAQGTRNERYLQVLAHFDSVDRAVQRQIDSQKTELLDTTGPLETLQVPSVEEDVSAANGSSARKRLKLEDVVPIDINSAGPELLMMLPRVGEAIAGRIIETRRERPFDSPGDLTRVKGIGPKTVEKMLPYIVAGSDQSKDEVDDVDERNQPAVDE